MDIKYQRTRDESEAVNQDRIEEREALAVTLLVNGMSVRRVAKISELPIQEISFQAKREDIMWENKLIEDRERSEDIRAAVMDTRVKEAREEGREEGQEEERREIAINLLTFGMSIRDIAKTTGLLVEEVEQIAKEL